MATAEIYASETTL